VNTAPPVRRPCVEVTQYNTSSLRCF
jgi:hypothetical protein